MRPRVLAAVILVAVTGALVAFQPLGSPWWSGYDYDSVYVGSGLTLFRGDRSNFYDHPGAVLQEGLAAVFTGAWLVSGDGSRAERAQRWVSNLDSTRPYLRAFASVVLAASAVIVFLTLVWVTRSTWLGLLGGLLFLGSPDVITWAAVVKPDPLLAALAVACVGLLVEAARRRSGLLYVAAAFVVGYDLSVKVQALGLAVPFAIALVLRPPRAGWWTDAWRDTRVWGAAHRRALLVAGGVWLALVLMLNALAAAPAVKPVAELAAGIVALAVTSAVAWLALRRTRLAALAATTIASAFAVIAGMVVPNLFYASVPAPMVRQAAITLGGGGVNSGAHPAAPVWGTLTSWHVFLIVAAVGLVAGFLARDLSVVLWAAGALALGFLAYLRFGEIHYYTAAIAVAAPLLLRAAQAAPVARPVVAAVLVAAALYQPYHDEIDSARARGREATSTLRVNRWVRSRLHGNDVALTYLEASDARIFHLVHFYTQWAAEPDYRFLPADPQGLAYVQSHDKRVAYVITGAAIPAREVASAAGLPATLSRVSKAPGFVYRVSA